MSHLPTILMVKEGTGRRLSRRRHGQVGRRSGNAGMPDNAGAVCLDFPGAAQARPEGDGIIWDGETAPGPTRPRRAASSWRVIDRATRPDDTGEPRRSG